MWAFCDPCGRWFYPEVEDGVAGSPTCPVCATEAASLAERPEANA